MVTDSNRPFWALIQELWLPLLPIIAYLIVVSWLDLQYHLEEFNFPISIVSILGTVIGLLLAFRTNSSYGRWWEARILWGAIVNDSRTWVRQLLEFSGSKPEQSHADEARQRMAYRQIAWCYSLSRSLRLQDPTKDMGPLIEPSEVEKYRTSHNVPNEILLRQAQELRNLYEDKNLELFQFVELEKTLTRLTDSMGGCERIKNTPFPTSYSRMVHGLIYVFILFLPFGLVKVPAIGLVCTSLSLAFGFLLIERVAIYLQDPFSNRPSDTPMLSLSRVIEINIKQMLGEQDLPEPRKPVNGVLY